jgi:integrase/recombinase XerD
MLKRRERRKQLKELGALRDYPLYTLQQAIDYVVSAKKAEGLRERTLTDYSKHWGYFTKWLVQYYAEVHYVSEITVDMIRNHVNYMRHDAKRYDGHKYISGEQGIGLSNTTINIRLRTLKAIFN